MKTRQQYLKKFGNDGNIYSLGFMRYSLLSNKNKQAFFVKLFLEGFGKGLENHEECKRRLAEMNEGDFFNLKQI